MRTSLIFFCFFLGTELGAVTLSEDIVGEFEPFTGQLGSGTEVFLDLGENSISGSNLRERSDDGSLTSTSDHLVFRAGEHQVLRSINVKITNVSFTGHWTNFSSRVTGFPFTKLESHNFDLYDISRDDALLYPSEFSFDLTEYFTDLYSNADDYLAYLRGETVHAEGKRDFSLLMGWDRAGWSGTPGDGSILYDWNVRILMENLRDPPLPGCGPSGGVPPKCDNLTAVPLPAALPILFAAIGSLGFICRWKPSSSHRSAA